MTKYAGQCLIRTAAILAIFSGLLSVVATDVKAVQPDCYETEDDAPVREIRERCSAYCEGCGCKSGTGFRGPPTQMGKRGSCVYKAEQLESVCGPRPREKCQRECTPRITKCVKAPVALSGNLISEQVIAPDQRGRIAAFEILVLTEGVTWDYKSTDSLRQYNTPFGPDQLRQLVQDKFAGASKLVAIGTASSEGNRRSEEQRAYERANALGRQLSDLYAPSKEVWLLNLGQNTVTCSFCEPIETSTQRPALVVAVIGGDPNVNWPEALRSALQQSSALKLNDYSLFQLAQFRAQTEDGAREL
jgi:hypothetical protein